MSTRGTGTLCVHECSLPSHSSKMGTFSTFVISFSKHREGREGILNNSKVAKTEIISPKIRKKTRRNVFLFSVILKVLEQGGTIRPDKTQSIQPGRSHIIPVCR